LPDKGAAAAGNLHNPNAYTARGGEQLFRFFAIWNVLEWSETAVAEYDSLKRAKVRIGTMDLKIASIALAGNATLLTRNRSDFSRVPGLRVEDWLS
jgi:tRNA(fMet)-specific endonuclease VapC